MSFETRRQRWLREARAFIDWQIRMQPAKPRRGSPQWIATRNANRTRAHIAAVLAAFGDET